MSTTAVTLLLAAALGCQPAVGANDAWAATCWPCAEAAVTRPSSLSPDTFPVPRNLEPRLRFWDAVFGFYDGRDLIVHDRRAPNVVWRVLRLPGVVALDDPGIGALEAYVVVDVAARLADLEAGTAPADAFDEHLLLLASGNGVLKGAAQRVRVQRGAADRLLAAAPTAVTLLAEVRQVLEEAKVPAELAALALVESMFEPAARSTAGAVGLWQLMPATARELGLEVSEERDQRLDLLPATRAAAELLRRNHRMLRSWPLAVTAYNHGAAGVRRALRSAGVSDLSGLIARHRGRRWGFASQNFYAEFVVMARLLDTYAAVMGPRLGVGPHCGPGFS